MHELTSNTSARGSRSRTGGDGQSVTSSEIFDNMSVLRELNAERLVTLEKGKGAVDAQREARVVPALADYEFPRLRAELTEAIRRALGRPELPVQIDAINRAQFAGDFVVKIPDLLRDGGPKNYQQTYVPQIVAALKSDAKLEGKIAGIETKGIYVNLRLRDGYLLDTLKSVLTLEARFGLSDTEKGRAVVIDYSSPNAAKQLHAGHIRSTIIGHVLGNLHDACGATVYRVNHINDIGGFGFLLEGYRRWNQSFPPEMSPNDRLLELYAIRRGLERIVEHSGSFDELSPSERSLAEKYLGPVSDMGECRSRYEEFRSASDAAYQRLERGEREEVARWREMVDWSLADFQKFYDALGIHLDFTVGESFYLELGSEVVDSALAAGTAVKWTTERAEAESARVQQRYRDGEIEERVRDSLIEGIMKDVGATVVPLSGDRRFVVRRADGGSIYATRDLGALKFRREFFNASDILYVVGQEQRDHFRDLFEASRLLRLTGDCELSHIYFGFYVDAATKRKLSSREGAANVHALLAMSRQHFIEKYSDTAEFPEGERQTTSAQLAVGSLVFNDLKKDMHGSVDINAQDLGQTISEFEKSGGAYVVYTACRAQGILRKSGGNAPSIEQVRHEQLADPEVALISLVQRLPEKVADASRSNDPSVLVRHLLDLSAEFNTYYAKYPVIKDGTINEHRLVVCAAVAQALRNGLRICHVECPERI